MEAVPGAIVVEVVVDPPGSSKDPPGRGPDPPSRGTDPPGSGTEVVAVLLEVVAVVLEDTSKYGVRIGSSMAMGIAEAI